MKSVLVSILAIPAISFVLACPPQGDSKREDIRALDLLKNRQEPPPSLHEIALSEFFAPGNDTNRFSTNDGATVEGIVKLVKDGGPETCNCHSKREAMHDIHIELTDSSGTNVMIVEITPGFRVFPSDQIKAKLTGKRIRVSGWLFFDEEHKQNARNTATSSGDIWRTTAWEVHPVVAIEVVQ